MARRTTSLPEFQEYVWDQLPFQRGMVGKEVVFDAVSVAVQEWPDEQLCGCKSGDTEELKATEALEASVRRHLRLSYGQEKFDTLWIVALQIILPIIVDQILKWWRRRKDHQGRLRIWRRKWVNGSDV